MPKPFSLAERKAIRRQLFAAGLKVFFAHGLRGARISDIAAGAGIAKGSFYAFFASKEELLMAIAAARDETHRTAIVAFLTRASGPPQTLLAEFFDFLMTRIKTDPLLKILQDRGETSHLMRKIPAEHFAKKAQRDRQFLNEIAALLKSRHGIAHVGPSVLEGLMTLMVCLAMQAPFMVATACESSLALLREMFVSRLIKGGGND